jgi:hypothetical protein
VDPVTPTVIATCRDETARRGAAVMRFEAGRSERLAPYDLGGRESDGSAWCPSILVLDSLDEPDYYDIARARHLHAAPGYMGGVLGDRFAVLPNDATTTRVYDARSGEERAMPLRIAADVLDHVRGEFAWSPQVATELRSGRSCVGGRLLIHGMTDDGRVLAGPGPSDRARGPLRWMRWDAFCQQ